MISTFASTLLKREQLTEHIYLFKFEPVDTEFIFKPGQYVIFHIPQDTGYAARRLYSMASPASVKDSYEVILEYVPGGVASEHLMKMKIGDTVTTQGPAGMFVLNENDKDNIFLATGTGIAPIRSMIYQELASHPNKKLILFWGFPYFKNIYLLDEFIELHHKHPNFMFYNCLSREGDLSCILEEDKKQFHTTGRVNDAFEKYITDDIMRYNYYVCGGPAVVDSLKEYIKGRGIPKEQLHFEKFTV